MGKPATFKVASLPGDKDVTGFTTATPGLVIWHVVTPDGEVMPHTWSVTHQASGLRVGPITGRARALRLWRGH